MDNAQFTKAHAKDIAQLKQKGQHVLTTVQNVPGTAYQKTSARIIDAIATGNRNIVILTNADNPELDNLTTLVKQSNLAIPSAQIQIVTR